MARLHGMAMTRCTWAPKCHPKMAIQRDHKNMNVKQNIFFVRTGNFYIVQ